MSRPNPGDGDSRVSAVLLAVRSFLFYLRSNLLVAIGVAAATAVLTGALIVGDSMRESLRRLTLERLGRIDNLVVSDNFFRSALADDLVTNRSEAADGLLAVPVIFFPNGTVEFRSGPEIRRAARVNVFGVPDSFWQLAPGMPKVTLGPNQVAINQELARQLRLPADPDIAPGLTLRIPKPSQLPRDSSLGRTRDLVESLPRLRAVHVLPNSGVARFSLHPDPSDPANLFIPVSRLQKSLAATALKFKSDAAQANTIFLSGARQDPSRNDDLPEPLVDRLQPNLEDLGFTLKHVRQTFAPPGKSQQVAREYFSLSSNRLVIEPEVAAAIRKTFPGAVEVFTYLANDIRTPDSGSGIPYSMVAAIDFSEKFAPRSAITGEPVQPLKADQIVLNQWAADDLDVGPGDRIQVEFFEPETTHGEQVETGVDLEVADVVELVEPVAPFLVRRRLPVRPAVFESRPAVANDPDLTPTVPGVTDAESIESWDLPFETRNRIRAEDDEYWNNFRTTPKAFVALETGQRIWSSRFGETTSFQIPAKGADGSPLEQGRIEAQLVQALWADQTVRRFRVIPVRQNGLWASRGATPFDVLFLALSMFVIGSALILVALLFRLTLAGRLDQIGVMVASGFSTGRVVRVWLMESVLLGVVGGLVGVLLGIGYAWLLVAGLKSWWIDAITEPVIELHLRWPSLLIGLFAGLVVAIVTVVGSVWQTRRLSVRHMLSGRDEAEAFPGRGRNWPGRVAICLIPVALGLSITASRLGGEAQAGCFVGAGFLILLALLVFAWQWLRTPHSGEAFSTPRLAVLNAKRNPLRSTLTVGLVAVASFLIAAISSFRLSPLEEGTGGFDWIAESSQPVFQDLNSESGREKLLGAEHSLPAGTEIFGLRVKPGQDASCNNLYQARQPQVLGVPQSLIDAFDDSDRQAFAFAAVDSASGDKNPWRVLMAKSEDDAIPVLIDKNTAWYSLKVFSVGQKFTIDYDSGESVTFRVAGFLNNSILQGSLLVSEQQFARAFPRFGGQRYFLIDEPDSNSAEAVGVLENRLGDWGFDARSAKGQLEKFLAVQNTYLSTFQMLGSLGLLLGTFGLAVVQARNVVDRQQELGMMQAVGWRPDRLARMVLFETAFLLLTGLAIGIIAACCATVPHYLLGSARIPFMQLASMFAAIVVIGLVAAAIASRLMTRLPLLDSLRRA